MWPEWPEWPEWSVENTLRSGDEPRGGGWVVWQIGPPLVPSILAVTRMAVAVRRLVRRRVAPRT